MKYEVFLEAAVNLYGINFLKYVGRLEIVPTMTRAMLEKDKVNSYQRKKGNVWQKQV